MQTLTVRFNRTLGLLFLLGGVSLGALMFWRFRSAPVLVLDAAIAAAGVAMMLRNYLVLGPSALEVRALLGPSKTVYWLDSPKDLSVDKGELLYKGEPTRATRLNADARDWQRLVDRVNASAKPKP